TRPHPKGMRSVRIALIPEIRLSLDRTPGLLWRCRVSTYKGSQQLPGLVRRASIELGERLSTQPSSKGQHTEGKQLLRSLSPVDETGITGPAVPVRRRQLLSPLSPRLSLRASGETRRDVSVTTVDGRKQQSTNEL